MKTLTRDHYIYSFDKAHAPALEIEPGEVVRIQTQDARTGTIRTNSDLLDVPSPGGGNPATGPIVVKGAQPGDSLAVYIEAIDLADAGFVAIKKNVGLLAHLTERFTTRIVPVRDGQVQFSDSIRFPARPMVGVIGTAPAGEAVFNGNAGPHGGNMDNLYVTTGSTIHLPVNVPGALFALGDVHATMGDGEITMLAVEIEADVTVRIDLVKGASVAWPWIETADSWITTGESMDTGQALRIAAEQMVVMLQDRLDLSFDDAFMLMSARCDVQICQACQPGEFPTTARAVFPKM